MVTEKMIEAALDAALKADIIPMDDPKHDGVRINDYLQYTPADAVELGVQLTEKNSDGKPRWHWYSDIMGDEHDDTNRAILRPLIKAALEAALSTDAEPVAFTSQGQLDAARSGSTALLYGKRDEFMDVALYAAPPAPSVAMKALEWKEDGKYLRARMGDREYSVNITADGETWAGATRPYALGTNLTWSSVPNCSMVSLESAKAACQADCQSRYAALSAQVQDVAEYERREQVCKEKAMSQWERSLKRPDLTEKDRVIGAVEAYKRQAFAFTMLAAAPAAKLEEKP